LTPPRRGITLYAMKLIRRALVGDLEKRLRGPQRFAQVVVGPRQVGKTTAVEQLLERWPGPSLYASADLPSPPDTYWIQSQWEAARQKARSSRRTTVIVLDEVQKVPRWSEVVKACLDEDRRSKLSLRAILLGSAALLVQKGAQESLAGRFEQHFCPHWSWPECHEAFGWTLDEWIFYGGYPGAAALVQQPARWAEYISLSLIESVLSRDVFQLTTIAKPALLRQLFMLALQAPSRILAYNKMLGQLQDAGNTVTLAHYLQLLSAAFLITGLNQWTGGLLRQRASSPKLVVWNNALINAWPGKNFASIQRHHDQWGWLVENAVGGYLLNQMPSHSVYYWRHDGHEVDYVLHDGSRVLALEVKSGRPRSASGLHMFHKQYPKAKTLIVGSGGIPLEQFFSTPPMDWF
jgi:uncharacterized protein